MKILLATANKHKALEMKQILSTVISSLELLTLKDLLAPLADVEETGSTLEENAFIKARAYFEATGIPCVADDTGLEVDALHGEPGVRTARFAGEDASYNDNVLLLLTRLNEADSNNRSARFRTVICYCDSLRTLFAEGECLGSIANEKRGEAGFGYDPVFIPDGYRVTFAEMDTQ